MFRNCWHVLHLSADLSLRKSVTISSNSFIVYFTCACQVMLNGFSKLFIVGTFSSQKLFSQIRCFSWFNICFNPLKFTFFKEDLSTLDNYLLQSSLFMKIPLIYEMPFYLNGKNWSSLLRKLVENYWKYIEDN